METIIYHKVGNILDELKKMYPTGIVLGGADAVVGGCGLTIEWQVNGQCSQQKFKADHRIPIIEIRGENFILGGYVPKLLIHYSHFKGFVKKNQ